MIITIVIFWVLFCLQQGWNDARHFANGTAHYIKTNSNYNIHTSLLIGRAIVFLLSLFTLFLFLGNWVLIVKVGAGLTLLFPFFHEGVYYSSRKKIDNPNEYPSTHFELWFSYSSPTSTAKINFPGWSRAVALIVGTFILLTTIQ